MTTTEAALRDALESVRSQCQSAIDLYERNGPSYTSQSTGEEYEPASYVQAKMRELLDTVDAALSQPSPASSTAGAFYAGWDACLSYPAKNLGGNYDALKKLAWSEYKTSSGEPASVAVEAIQLERWGFKWRGHDHGTHERMADGYWTPWHIAQDALNAAALSKLTRETH